VVEERLQIVVSMDVVEGIEEGAGHIISPGRENKDTIVQTIMARKQGSKPG